MNVHNLHNQRDGQVNPPIAVCTFVAVLRFAANQKPKNHAKALVSRKIVPFASGIRGEAARNLQRFTGFSSHQTRAHFPPFFSVISAISHLKTNLSKMNSRLSPLAASALALTAATGAMMLQMPATQAASVTKYFEGGRDDNTTFSLYITYDDAITKTVPTDAGMDGPIPPGGTYGTQCNMMDTVGPYANGNCYINTDGDGSGNGQQPIAPWAGIAPFTGHPITNVTGTITDSDLDVYNVIGLAQIGSFEGGKVPLIPHYISDNLIDDAFFFSLDDAVAGKGISQGGFVILTANDNYQYQLFSNPATGKLAGCGSGECAPVKPTPAPIPVLGAAAAFGSIRRLKKFSSHLRSHSIG
ncbi:MAG: hypothetical protein ACK40D_02675 [Cyanobacteriota bacterium]